MRVHNLKTWPEYYAAVRGGSKRFELRLNDRDFQVGDKVALSEYDPKTESYTNDHMHLRITYVYTGSEFGLKEGWCIFSFEEDI